LHERQGFIQMGKFATAIATDKKRPGSPCLVGVALDDPDFEDHDELVAALDRKSGIPYAVVMRGLRAAGYRVGDNAVSRHVAGECACG
jgi:hypothetical protein